MRSRAALLARVKLQALVSAYGWSLWGVIQSNASHLDYDFDSWALEHYEKAVAGFTSRRFGVLLEVAAGGDDLHGDGPRARVVIGAAG